MDVEACGTSKIQDAMLSFEGLARCLAKFGTERGLFDVQVLEDI